MLVTWNWNRLPAFWAFCVGWIFLATNELSQKHPSRWHHCPSYYEFLRRLALNTASAETIAANSNLAAIEAYEKSAERRRLRLEAELKEQEKQEVSLQQELGDEIENVEKAEQYGNKTGGILGGIVEHPLKGILYPIQKQLSELVSTLRIAKHIVLWKEAYYSFWITTACFSVAVVAIMVPWAFVLRWLCRLVVLVGMGPWMRIVDQKYFQTNPNLSDEEQDAEFRQRMKSRYDEVVKSATNYFQRKERALKLLSMKQYMFGKFTLLVPHFCEDLYDDIPLPSSSCTPYTSKVPIRVEQVKFGQTLKGDMIPKREIEVVAAAETSAKADKKKRLRGVQSAALKVIPLLDHDHKKTE